MMLRSRSLSLAVRSLSSSYVVQQKRWLQSVGESRSVRAGGTSTESGRRGPISWAVLGLAGILGTSGVWYYAREKERKMEEVMAPRAVGRASIGGPFSLIDGSSGKRVDESLLLGHWSLVYFGFTACPDICPAELSKVGEALGILEERGVRLGNEVENTDLVPIFITVDPERDTPKMCSEYAKVFHDSFIGLAGNEDEVRQAAKAYRVYYSKTDEESPEYLVDHSIITYLMDPRGEFREFYGKNTTAVEIASKIRGQMMSISKSK